MNDIKSMQQCPKCLGTTKAKLPDSLYQFRTLYPSYDAETNTVMCDNCGLQYGAMPTGIVPTNKDNQPCLHKYEQKTIGRCYNEYTCIHCNDKYSIDSSD